MFRYPEYPNSSNNSNSSPAFLSNGAHQPQQRWSPSASPPPPHDLGLHASDEGPRLYPTANPSYSFDLNKDLDPAAPPSLVAVTGIGLEPPVVDCTDHLFGKCMTQSCVKSLWWRPSYFVDWAIVALVAIVDIIEVTLWNPNVNPYQAAVQSANGTFSFDDNQFQFPIQTETFKPWVTAIISVGIPLALAFCYHLFLRFGPPKDRSLHDIHHFFLGMATAVALAYFAWIPTNRLCGQFRPDFWYRLQTGDSGTITDGRESFPSGHALCAFLGLGFLMLWMCGKLFVFHSGGGHMWRFFLAVMCPMALAFTQAVSRVTNYLHHPVDILGGAVLGMGAAICAYHLNYPPVWAPDCHRPKNRKFSYFTYVMAGVPPAPQADPHFSA